MATPHLTGETEKQTKDKHKTYPQFGLEKICLILHKSCPARGTR